jgi:arabinofuranosyltransferase
MALSAIGMLVLCYRLRDFTADDAWISARYAENLAAGHGFVWNPGGVPDEGFSNPLLVYGEALAHWCGWSSISFARTLGVLCAAACVCLVYLRGRDVVGEVAARSATVLTGLCPPMALWAVGGLETTVTALVVTAAVLELAGEREGRPWLAGALLAVLPWLRPEGLVVALPVAVVSTLPGIVRRSSRGNALVRLAVIAGLPLVSQALLEVVRLAAYGHLLPNSVYYRVGTGGLIDVALKFVRQSWPVLSLALVGILGSRWRHWVLVVPLAVYFVGSLGTLDTVNTASRYFLATWPQVALLAGLGIAMLWQALPTPLGTVVAVTAVSVCAGMVVAVLPRNLRSATGYAAAYRDCRTQPRLAAASWLRTHTPQDAVVSISDAGLVPARSGGRTFVDQFMLNEPLIQRTGVLRNSQRAELVFARHPDVIVLASTSTKSFVPAYPVDGVIGSAPDMTHYPLTHVVSPRRRSCPYSLYLYRRVG